MKRGSVGQKRFLGADSVIFGIAHIRVTRSVSAGLQGYGLRGWHCKATERLESACAGENVSESHLVGTLSDRER